MVPILPMAQLGGVASAHSGTAVLAQTLSELTEVFRSLSRRWYQQWGLDRGLSLFFSLSLALCPSFSLSFYLSIYLSICFSTNNRVRWSRCWGAVGGTSRSTPSRRKARSRYLGCRV